MPEITVLMPAYNCEQYVAEAIQSVLNQTFSDFELLIIDDSSTDNTLSVIESFNDPRIVVKKSHHDCIATLNIGLQNASGRYIARMDADDLMVSDRLAIQYSILEESPNIDVCGGWMQIFGENTSPQVIRTTSGDIEWPLLLMLKTNFVFNSTTMCRTAFIRKHNLFYKYYMYAEDFMFWSEAARCGARFFNESQILHYYRMWGNQVGRKYSQEQKEAGWKTEQEIIKWFIHDYPNSEIEAFHQQACRLNQQGLLPNRSFVDLFHLLYSQLLKK